MKTITASDRKSLIRLAATLPKGSPERRVVLAGLSKSAYGGRGPVWTEALERRWNDLHDIERELEDVAREYDVAGSYHSGKGRKDALKIRDLVQATVKALEAISMSGGLFDTLMDAEMKFVKQYGTPSEYAEDQRDAMYPR
tara:strand:+ start:5939 stop:6361 length:423 start_codon:yes stop_codon:yes gene_type:complete